MVETNTEATEELELAAALTLRQIADNTERTNELLKEFTSLLKDILGLAFKIVTKNPIEPPPSPFHKEKEVTLPTEKEPSSNLEDLVDSLDLPLMITKGFPLVRGEWDQTRVGYWICNNPSHERNQNHLNLCDKCTWYRRLGVGIKSLLEVKE